MVPRMDDPQRARYERDGYLVFDPGITPAEIDAAVAGIEALFLPPDQPPDTSGSPVAYRDSRRIQDAWRVNEPVKRIATAPAVLDLLARLYGRAPLPFQTLNFRVGSEQRAHSDTIHFNALPSGYMCGVWVALEDIDMDIGPLVYYPGSHALPEATLRDAVGEAAEPPSRLQRWLARATRRPVRRPIPTQDAYLRYEEHIAEVIASSGIPPAYATIRKGQAFLWAANLLHGGSPQRDRRRTRLSQVTHYYFEGCRYYTPLLSTRRVTQWRTPTRIA